MRLATTRVSRRSALQLLAGGAGVVAISACGLAGNAPPAATAPVSSSTPAPASGAPRRGGTLRLAIPADITSLDGHISSSNLSTTTGNIFDRLVAYDVKLQPQPMLAESWDVSDDYKQVKLNLRKGVQWHTGRDFTSEDVKYNLQRGRDPKVGSGTYVNQAKWFDTFDTPDKYTLVMHSDVSRPAMFDYFNALNMVDPVTAEGPNAKTQTVGTGPFTFVEWVQGDHLTLARNTNYWRSDRPYVDSIVINVVRDVVAMATRLEAGALDAINAPSLEDFVRLKADAKVRGVDPAGPELRPGRGRDNRLSADRQQAGPSGAQLRARSQALRRDGFAGHRAAAVSAVGQELARVRSRQRELLRVRPRQSQVAAWRGGRHQRGAGLPGIAQQSRVQPDLRRSTRPTSPTLASS